VAGRAHAIEFEVREPGGATVRQKSSMLVPRQVQPRPASLRLASRAARPAHCQPQGLFQPLARLLSGRVAPWGTRSRGRPWRARRNRRRAAAR
jgi:hypothetical protein